MTREDTVDRQIGAAQQRLERPLQETEAATDQAEDIGDGTADDMSLALHDLTVDEQRGEAKRALQPSEGHWRSVVENAPDIISIVDREGQILYINHPPAGLTRQQAVGTNALDYVVAEHRPITQRAIDRVFETREPASYEISAGGRTTPSPGTQPVSGRSGAAGR